MNNTLNTDLQSDLYIGVISGTSMDGLDIAVVRFPEGKLPEVLATATVTFPAALQKKLRALALPGDNEIYQMGLAHAELGDFIGRQILLLLAAECLGKENVCAIGSHGQTIRHHPRETAAFTLQIGDPSRIAEITGIKTVADFRSRDIAAGGEGAPLACAYHRHLFARIDEAQAVINLGGIANITLLQPDDTLIGFDTGPANVLMDSWCLHKTNQAMDEAGHLAGQGRVDETLLSACMADPYFAKKPPKSTGREYFHLHWLLQKIAQTNSADLSLPDMLATLAYLTADTVADALADAGFQPQSIWVCGGGRHNKVVMARLSERCQGRAKPVEEAGVDGDSLEAAAFAYLARECIAGRPGNVPTVTGANGSRLLGAIYAA